MKVNIDSIRLMLDAARSRNSAAGELIKFIFTSSLDVYGGPLPEVVNSSTFATPEGAYGMGKLVAELMVNEYTRRGLIDGRILRLPTIVVPPGLPSPVTSAFISDIIRGPPSRCRGYLSRWKRFRFPRAEPFRLGRQSGDHRQQFCHRKVHPLPRIS